MKPQIYFVFVLKADNPINYLLSLSFFMFLACVCLWVCARVRACMCVWGGGGAATFDVENGIPCAPHVQVDQIGVKDRADPPTL